MTVDPSRCPDCREPFGGAASCPSCGLLLRGPLAARLWQVSVELDRLENTRQALLETLRPGGVAVAPPEAVPGTRAGAQAAISAEPVPEPSPQWAAYQPSPSPSSPRRPRAEWTPQRVQNVLLATGALLLVVAAIAFTAFAWGRLPIAARGAVMVAVTAVTGWSARWAHRRELAASAEAIALLAVLFGAVDAYAAYRANLFGLRGTDPGTYWSVASGVLAVGAAAFARVVPVRSVRYAALAGAQVPLLVTAFRLPGLTYAERGAFLGAQAAGLAYGAKWLGETAFAARVSALANWGVGVALALTTAYGTAAVADARTAALVLAGLGAVALLAPGGRTVPAGVATLAVVLAVVAPARLTLTFVQLPLAVSAAGLLAVVAAALAPGTWRRGPLVVGAGTVAAAVAAVSPWVAQAVVLPFTWADQPWGLAGDLPARAALAEDGTRWGGSVVTLAVVAVAAVAAVVVAEALGRWDRARWWVAGLVSGAVLLVPLAFATSYLAALTWYVVAGVGGLAASYALRRVVVAVPATVVLGVATAWSLAHEGATLVVLLAVALAYAAYATLFDRPREAAAAVAATAGAGYAVALAASRGAPTDRVAFVLAAASFALAAAAWLLPRVRSVEAVAAVAYGTALMLHAEAGADPGWLAWTLGGGAVVAAATAVRPERRQVAALAALLTCGCAAAASFAYGAPLERAGLVVALTACGVFAAGRLVRLDDVTLVAAGAYAIGTLATVDDVSTLAYALGAGALTAGAGAYLDRRYAPAAAALGIACAGVTTYAAGGRLDRAGFAVALAASAAVGLGAWLRGTDGDRVEQVAAVAYGGALLLTADDLGWLSWVLAVGGVTALADALRHERRWLNWVATALLTAWSWDRLWIEDVRVPEAYAAPVAVLVLALGHLRRRRDPSTGSWQAYGRGLAVGFLPTSLLVVTDPGVTRPVLLAVAGAAVLLAGVRERLQAPLTIGAAALAVDAVVQLAPVAVALPKWATIGAVGLLVIAVGVTYEERRRDVARLRQTFDSLV